MSEKIKDVKNIIAFFLGVDAESIDPSTVIDKSVLSGSVKVHMMFGDLADHGYKVADYTNIRTFGELLSKLRLSGESNSEIAIESPVNIMNKSEKIFNTIDIPGEPSQGNSIGLGVDIFHIGKLPRVDDFRESSFYTDNFSLKEFAYCLLKQDPYKCFAGKFAAKEAIVKANGEFRKISFKEIEILNDADGKPYFNNFSISITHEDDYAIAIAAYYKNPVSEDKAAGHDKLKEEILTEVKQIMDKVTDGMGSNYLKKSYKGLIAFSLILNILMAAYIAYQVYLLF